MVCYGGAGNVSYCNAYKLGPIQQEILDELYQAIQDPTADPLEIDMDLASKLIDEKLQPELVALEVRALSEAVLT